MTLVAWRHPKPREVAGRCLGRTDAAVDRRKAKRLAHRIRAWARRHRAARVVLTSPLRRAAGVGRWLARWGWQHRIDARLSELDFGAWDGRAWSDIAPAEIGAWCAAFASHRPGGGESVDQLLRRCRAFIADARAGAIDGVLAGAHADASRPVCIVGHAGWLSAATWVVRHDAAPSAAEWPASVGYGARVVLEAEAEATPSARARMKIG